MQNFLANANASRTFFTQSLLTQDTNFDKDDKQKKTNKKVYDRDLVRTDSKSQSIDIFLTKASSNQVLNTTTTTTTSNNNNINNSNNNNDNNVKTTVSEFTTLKSRFSNQLNSEKVPSSKIEVFEINKSNDFTLNHNSSDLDFSKSSLDIFSNKNTTKTIEDDRDKILPLSEHNSDVFKLKTTTHSEKDQDDIMVIERPAPKENPITNIEIFDSNNIPNLNKRIHDYSSISNISSSKLNKKPKYTDDDYTTITKPIFNSNYLYIIININIFYFYFTNYVLCVQYNY